MPSNDQAIGYKCPVTNRLITIEFVYVDDERTIHISRRVDNYGYHENHECRRECHINGEPDENGAEDEVLLTIPRDVLIAALIHGWGGLLEGE
jgi:hypothetical protein